MTEGYSCGDLIALCREALRRPLREAKDRYRRLQGRAAAGMHACTITEIHNVTLLRSLMAEVDVRITR
jgi:SpoVK/Ycf46/Vps4 family AAA+-type ATPase